MWKFCCNIWVWVDGHFGNILVCTFIYIKEKLKKIFKKYSGVKCAWEEVKSGVMYSVVEKLNVMWLCRVCQLHSTFYRLEFVVVTKWLTNIDTNCKLQHGLVMVVEEQVLLRFALTCK